MLYTKHDFNQPKVNLCQICPVLTSIQIFVNAPNQMHVFFQFKDTKLMYTPRANSTEVGPMRASQMHAQNARFL